MTFFTVVISKKELRKAELVVLPLYCKTHQWGGTRKHALTWLDQYFEQPKFIPLALGIKTYDSTLSFHQPIHANYSSLLQEYMTNYTYLPYQKFIRLPKTHPELYI